MDEIVAEVEHGAAAPSVEVEPVVVEEEEAEVDSKSNLYLTSRSF